MGRADIIEIKPNSLQHQNLCQHFVCFILLKMSPNRLLVFVYGTLKKGEPNHHWLSSIENGFQQFHGQALTVNLFPLVIASRYNIPYLMDKAGIGNKIMGEIYEVDEKMLEKLDELEDHPRYYERRVEQVTKVNT